MSKLTKLLSEELYRKHKSFLEKRLYDDFPKHPTIKHFIEGLRNEDTDLITTVIALLQQLVIERRRSE